MDINVRCCYLLAILLAAVDIAVLGKHSAMIQPLRRADTEIETATPPLIFPKLPQSPSSKDDSEVPDLLKEGSVPQPNPETDIVDHPNVVDPGKTHEQGGMAPKAQNVTTLEDKTNVTLIVNETKEESTVAVTEDERTLNVTEEEKTFNMTKVESTPNVTKEEVISVPNVTVTNSTEEEPKTSVIHTCNFPKSWLKHTGNISSFDDWLEKSDNDTNMCSFPPDWLDNNDTLHICTINKEWLKANNYTIQNGSISKELLADTNTTNIRCVTPKDALQDDDINSNDTSHYSTVLPKAWLKERNDIYIYLVPEDVYENMTETEAEAHTPPKVDTSSATESNGTLTDDTARTGVNITTVATTVKGSSNKTPEETTTNLPGSSTSETTLVNVTGSTSQIPKINTAVEDSNKNSTALDKNKTIQDNDKVTKTLPTTTTATTTTTTTLKPPASTPSVGDDVQNIIDNTAGTTPSSPVALLQRHMDHDHSSSSGKTAFLQPTESAAILAGVFVGIALLGYIGLLVWRRVLERRYGHREMLVNEDDDFDSSDMRNFEMQNTRSSSSVVF